MTEKPLKFTLRRVSECAIGAGRDGARPCQTDMTNEWPSWPGHRCSTAARTLRATEEEWHITEDRWETDSSCQAS